MRRPGRPNLGARHVAGLCGSEDAKSRLSAVLRTLTGETSLKDACLELGIGPSRFAEIRTEALLGALSALEPKPAGRPPSRSEKDPVVDELESKVASLERELKVAEAHAEVTTILAHAGKRKSKSDETESETQHGTAPKGGRKGGRKRGRWKDWKRQRRGGRRS